MRVLLALVMVATVALSGDTFTTDLTVVRWQHGCWWQVGYYRCVSGVDRPW